jgi:SAM-dependent methyltransferase
LSEKRIQRILDKHFFELKNHSVLEAGCGAGRFTEVLSRHAKSLVSLDISNAVDAAHQNLNPQNSNVKFLQADILDLPLRRNFFDVAICVGVLQHTPNTLEAMREIVACVKPGGWIFVDHYKLKLKNLYPPVGGFGNIFRLFVKRMEPNKALLISRKWVEFFFPIHWRHKDSRIIQSFLFRISPVRFYYPWLGLEGKQDYFDWAVLDTYDGSADKFKRRRTKRKLICEIESLGMVNIEVWEGGNGLEARFQKP